MRNLWWAAAAGDIQGFKALDQSLWQSLKDDYLNEPSYTTLAFHFAVAFNRIDFIKAVEPAF